MQIFTSFDLIIDIFFFRLLSRQVSLVPVLPKILQMEQQSPKLLSEDLPKVLSTGYDGSKISLDNKLEETNSSNRKVQVHSSDLISH